MKFIGFSLVLLMIHCHGLVLPFLHAGTAAPSLRRDVTIEYLSRYVQFRLVQVVWSRASPTALPLALRRTNWRHDMISGTWHWWQLLRLTLLVLQRFNHSPRLWIIRGSGQLDSTLPP